MGQLSHELAREFLLDHLRCRESLEHLLFTNEPPLSSAPGGVLLGLFPLSVCGALDEILIN